jgi:hypothetical protein
LTGKPAYDLSIPCFAKLNRRAKVKSKVQVSAWLGNHPLLVSFSISAVFVAVICLLFNPHWDTNDDVAMSMVAHGYGLASHGSPNLVFSNTLWGYFVRALPEAWGLLGYSIATLLALVLAATAIVYFLLRMGADLPIAGLVLSLLFFRPVIFPQFTINAGLLTCGAILAWLAYARTNSTAYLLAASMFAFFGYLVRNVEFALVLLVSLPALTSAAFFKQRPAQLTLALLACGIIFAAWFDYISASDSTWAYFWELNRARAPFTDFGADARLLARPDIMARYGLSKNDVHLLANWFFVDSQIGNPAKLRAIFAELGFPKPDHGIRSGLSAIQALADPRVVPLLIPALVIGAALFKSRNLGCWLVGLMAIFVLGFAGRPGIMRVYFPLVAVLLVMPIALAPPVSAIPRILVVVSLVIANILNVTTLLPEVPTSGSSLRAARNLGLTTQEPIAIWGSSFPFERVYPVLATAPELPRLKMLALGVFTYAPFSASAFEELNGSGFIPRLRSAQGILISATDDLMALLDTYCREHLAIPSETTEAYKSELGTVWRVRCNAPEPPPSEKE